MTQAPTHAPDSGSLRIPFDQREIDDAQSRIVAMIERHGYPKASVFALRLSLHEAVANAFKHGHKDLPQETPITLAFHIADDHVELSVEDQGPGFDPGAIPDPTLEENLERGSGRGLLLIRAYMTSADFNAKGNKLTLVYRRPSAN